MADNANGLCERRGEMPRSELYAEIDRLNERLAELPSLLASACESLSAQIAEKDEEIAMLRDAETRWIARLAVVLEVTGDGGKMMLADFAVWFDKRWNELLAAEAALAATRAEVEKMREALELLSTAVDAFWNDPERPSIAKMRGNTVKDVATAQAASRHALGRQS